MSSRKLSIILLIFLAFFSIKSSFVFAQEATSTENSANVNIYIEPQTYIPPFYRGMPLFSNQSTIKIILFPDVIINGEKISSKNLIYKWKKNDIVLGDYSGLGKDTLNLNLGLLLKDVDINFSIYDSNNQEITTGFTTINIKEPKIVFYENNPLYGILFNRNLNSGFNLGTKEELKIVAKPLFFSASTDISPNLNYFWSVNDQSINFSGKKNSLLLRQTSSADKGVTSVSLQIDNSTNDFQSANSEFNINFGE